MNHLFINLTIFINRYLFVHFKHIIYLLTHINM